MDVGKLQQAHEDFLGVASDGGFGPPPPGEWDAARLLAHVAATDASIAAVALAIAAGQRPSYDNRSSLDNWNLQRLVDAHGGDVAALAGLVRRYGALLCTVAAELTDADLAVQLPVLIVSGDELVVDEPRPLRLLVDGVAEVHLPRHAVQLQALRPAPVP